MTKNVAKLGSVSTGTMLAKDLIRAFMAELDALDREASMRISGEYQTVEDEEYCEVEDEEHMLEALFEALDACSPPFSRFGAHNGDGCDYGFWLDMDSLDEAVRDGDVLKVNAGDEWPDVAGMRVAGYEYVLEVSDHGNMTLYTLEGVEVWGVV